MRQGHSGRIGRSGFIFAGVIALLGITLFHGLRATHDLSWHPGTDAYRDIALAQTILEGEYPADYLIQGEWHWYNPLTGAVVAAGSWLLDMPPPLANVRIAPYLNLTVPLAFFLLIWYLADAWVALVALVSFLFIVPQERPSYVTAGYSPWLLAPHLTQALFYVTLIAWLQYLKEERWRYALGAGVLLGVTFLGHTAPAVLLGCIMALTGMMPPHNRKQTPYGAGRAAWAPRSRLPSLSACPSPW